MNADERGCATQTHGEQMKELWRRGDEVAAARRVQSAKCRVQSDDLRMARVAIGHARAEIARLNEAHGEAVRRIGELLLERDQARERVRQLDAALRRAIVSDHEGHEEHEERQPLATARAND